MAGILDGYWGRMNAICKYVGFIITREGIIFWIN